LLSNYHTHTHFCDGKEPPEEYVKVALSLGFKALGFSAHAPLPFANDWTLTEENLPEYIEEVTLLKKKYKNQIEIFLGLEIDYIEGLMSAIDERYDSLNLDYKIGSVHLLEDLSSKEYFGIDGPDEEFMYLFQNVFDRDIKEMSGEYYRLMAKMVRQGGFDFIGHLDLIKKKNTENHFFREEESWYQNQVIDFLNVVKESGKIIEVNTGGIARGATKEVYPSLWILKYCNELDIPIMLNADAHSPKQLAVYFEKAFDVMREAGYQTRKVLTKGDWIDIEF
jgi:histidinol-phosphatase (PHP family)